MSPELRANGYGRQVAFDDLDMYAVMIFFQRDPIQPRPIIDAARRAIARGEGGEHTREVAAMSDQIGRDTVEAIAAHMDGLLEECGCEKLDSVDAAQRTLLTLCRRIVDGDMSPTIGASLIGQLAYLPPSARLPWDTIRPFFSAAEDLHPDDEPSEALVVKVEREIVDEATRVLNS